MEETETGDPSETISEQYICLQKKLYSDQRATVLADVESDEFKIARGTKQRDPLSSLLFNSVLHSAMEKDVETWKAKGLGITLSDEKRDCISNPRFADDVLMSSENDRGLQKKY